MNQDAMQRRWRGDFHTRQREWEDEVDRFRRDFFRNTPFDESVRREPRLRLFPESRSYFDVPETRVPETRVRLPDHEVSPSQIPHPDRYCVEFELADFEPQDIAVKVEDFHLTVSARREIDGNVREMTKSVEIPPHVDPAKLISHFSPDGILTVETLQPPCYESVQRCAMSPNPNEAESSEVH